MASEQVSRTIWSHSKKKSRLHHSHNTIFGSKAMPDNTACFGFGYYRMKDTLHSLIMIIYCYKMPIKYSFRTQIFGSNIDFTTYLEPVHTSFKKKKKTKTNKQTKCKAQRRLQSQYLKILTYFETVLVIVELTVQAPQLFCLRWAKQNPAPGHGRLPFLTCNIISTMFPNI